MAGKASLVLSFALLALLHLAAGQTRHTVGDATGWTNTPPGGAVFYVNWAAGKTFVVGDTLVFNFGPNQDVQRVTKQSFDRCDDDNGDIGDDFEISPAIINLSAAGDYYFISSNDNHCAQGQKLAITVVASRGAAPPPSNTPPAPRMTPPPTTATPPPRQTVHTVGDATGWAVPPGGAAFYVNWAAGKIFAVGDSLVFNFRSNEHDVQRVTKQSFDRCDDDNGDIGDDIEISPATINLATPGEYYFISTKDNQCELGQKLAITVVASSGAAPPPTTMPPAPRTTPPPTTATPPPRLHTVGDTTGWTVPTGGAAFYVKWAASKTFAVGDSLVFNFRSNEHDVQRVTKQAFDRCDDDNGDIGDDIEISPATINLSTPGEYYFISTKDNQCELGQKLAINVSATRGATPPSSNAPPSTATPPTSSTTPPPTTAPSTPTVHTVGDATGWAIPPNNTFYSNWAAGKTFVVGDSLVFNFASNTQDVQRVTKESFDRCDDDNGDIGDDIETGPATITLTTPGEYYFICTKDNHCERGQKLAINVSATRGASTPSNGPMPPPAGRGPQFATPGSSAHAVAATLSATVFGLVLSLF